MAPTKADAATSEDQPKEYEVKGEKFTLPPKLPFAVLRYVRKDEVEIGALAEVIFGDDADRFFDLGLDVDEGAEALDNVLQLYGVSSGESPASQES